MNDTPGRPSADDEGDKAALDRQWFDRLAGRPNQLERLNPAAAAEVDLLRKAFARAEARHAAEDKARAQTDERLRAQLIEAARRQGLVRGAAPRPRALFWQIIELARQLATPRPFAIGAVAALALAVALPRLWTPEAPRYGPPTRMMGLEAVQTVTDARPQVRAEAIAARLKAEGYTVRLYQSATVFFVDVEIRPEQMEAAAPLLRALGLAPRPGIIRVQVRAP